MASSTWDDDDDPVDDWEDDDFGDDDEEPTVTCPYCGEEVHEDSPRCPHCENYLSREEFPSGPKPWWILLGAGLGLLAFLTWLFL